MKLDTIFITKKNHLKLYKKNELNLNGFSVDFCNSILNFRLKSNQKKEAIVKAVGIKNKYYPNVLDATAGMGYDSFLLAYFGCHVNMLERNLTIAMLLNDGLKRGYKNEKIGKWLYERMHLVGITNAINAIPYYPKLFSKPDVIYLDPMFPVKKKSALVKKKMQLLHILIGHDYDADFLLKPSLNLAKKRVVVKRPYYAKPLAGIKAQTAIISGHYRFDIYFPDNYKNLR